MKTKLLTLIGAISLIFLTGCESDDLTDTATSAAASSAGVTTVPIDACGQTVLYPTACASSAENFFDDICNLQSAENSCLQLVSCLGSYSGSYGAYSSAAACSGL